MSHRDSETIKKQAEMGQAHNKKVLTWKHEVENKAQAKELLSEIDEKQWGRWRSSTRWCAYNNNI